MHCVKIIFLKCYPTETGRYCQWQSDRKGKRERRRERTSRTGGRGIRIVGGGVRMLWKAWSDYPHGDMSSPLTEGEGNWRPSVSAQRNSPAHITVRLRVCHVHCNIILLYYLIILLSVPHYIWWRSVYLRRPFYSDCWNPHRPSPIAHRPPPHLIPRPPPQLCSYMPSLLDRVGFIAVSVGGRVGASGTRQRLSITQ